MALVALAAGLLTSLNGCGGKHWKVVRAMPEPSPLRGAGPIVVSFDYSRLEVQGKPEPQWVQDKSMDDATYPEQWAKLKGVWESSFLEAFQSRWPAGVIAGPPGPQGAHVMVIPVGMTIGKYIGIARSFTTVIAALSFSVNGAAAEEIELSGAVGANLYRPSVFQHMPLVGRYMGENAGEFVASKN